MKRLRILTLCSVLLAVLIFCFKKRKPTTIAAGEGLVIEKSWLYVNPHPITPAKDVRPADQTFLTFPEWYLVFSPEEQAEYFKYHTASSFPYMSHVAQFWESYHIVNNQIKGNFPDNDGYHLMIWVIGSSTTAEYAIKAWYETIVGRITDTRTVRTSEDHFNAVFVDDYVRFIKDRAWYEYDFISRLKSLWTEVPLASGRVIRSMERRYILSSELLVKAAYGKLIGLGTKTVYEEALPTTAVVLDSTGSPNKRVVSYVPRYDRFREAAKGLARRGVQVREVAGNNSAILLSIIVPQSTTLNIPNTQVLFSQPISSNRSLKRVAVVCKVDNLTMLLSELNAQSLTVEHVFDY
jgi:hypothetical protein